MKIKDGGTFGDILREARLEKGWSQRELAHQAGLDASYINRLESGDRQPGRDAALVLAGALSVDEANLDHWLTAAGHAPMPLLTQVRGAVRTRGVRSARYQNRLPHKGNYLVRCMISKKWGLEKPASDDCSRPWNSPT